MGKRAKSVGLVDFQGPGLTAASGRASWVHPVWTQAVAIHKADRAAHNMWGIFGERPARPFGTVPRLKSLEHTR